MIGCRSFIPDLSTPKDAFKMASAPVTFLFATKDGLLGNAKTSDTKLPQLNCSFEYAISIPTAPEVKIAHTLDGRPGYFVTCGPHSVFTGVPVEYFIVKNSTRPINNFETLIGSEILERGEAALPYAETKANSYLRHGHITLFTKQGGHCVLLYHYGKRVNEKYACSDPSANASMEKFLGEIYEVQRIVSANALEFQRQANAEAYFGMKGIRPKGPPYKMIHLTSLDQYRSEIFFSDFGALKAIFKNGLVVRPDVDGDYLYVMDALGNFYLTPKSKNVGHDSLLDGQPVVCAGTMTIENEKLIKLNDYSYIYPSNNSYPLNEVARRLKIEGFNLNEVNISYEHDPHKGLNLPL